MIKNLTGDRLLFFDGACGTMLQDRGMTAGESPELWNISHPDILEEVHAAYLESGCDIVSANTFTVNRLRLRDTGVTVQQSVESAVNAARAAVSKATGSRYVALDIGPTGRLMQPLGDLPLEEAVDIYAEVIRAGAAAGADLVIIETMTDTRELKAAVLAAKENCSLPVFASVTLDRKGRMMTGGNVESAAALLEGLGADAIGLNCSLGPDELLPFLKELIGICSVPVFFQPNAGLPYLRSGKTVFPVGPQEYARLMLQAAEAGARVLGGCCGTTPEHIRAMIGTCRGFVPVPIVPKHRTCASSYGRTVTFTDAPVVIGERINPTGKPKLKQALRDRDTDYVLREALSQQEQGAHALDVNAGLPEIDEGEVLPALVESLQAVTDLPLQIDTADTGAMEKSLRVYNGKAIINSVTGKKESMDAIFPLVKKYGGLVVALTLDEQGIPETAGGRVEIAKNILDYAAKFGLGREDFLFDALTLTLSAGKDNANVTIEAMRRMKEELGVHTVLGVSNVSFGMPRRDLIGAAFFRRALDAGLSAAIINPHAESMTRVLRDFLEGRPGGTDPAVAKALAGEDEDFREYLEKFANSADAPAAAAKPAAAPAVTLGDAILKGLKSEAAAKAGEELEHREALDVIDSLLIPALNLAGQKFENGTLFLPQLLMTADAARAAFDVVRASLPETANEKTGAVILATVEGDVHDIGKNIVRAIMENYNFRVIDLGKDVRADKVLQAAQETGASLIGLSALMTTTAPNMKKTIELLRKHLPDRKIMVGGAVLTEEYAGSIGADFYAPDAMSGVRYAQEVFSGCR